MPDKVKLQGGKNRHRLRKGIFLKNFISKQQIAYIAIFKLTSIEERILTAVKGN